MTVMEGRRFIGIELDEQHFNAACQRIAAAYAEPDMFVEAAKPELAQQLDLMEQTSCG